MKDLFDQIQIWLNNDQSVALATVIKTWGSSPRQVGAGMAISDTSEIAGSVSGGCVEGAVIDAALEVLKTGKPARLHFGVGDDQAWEVGLSCGGEIDVFIRQFDQGDLEVWKKALTTTGPVFMALILEGEDPFRGSDLLIEETGEVTPDYSQSINRSLRDVALENRETGIYQVDSTKIREVFLNRLKPAPELILVGGVHITIPLASIAKTVGFEVIIIDPRRLFSRADRFPEVKLLIPEWPETAFQKIKITGSSAIVMLTHDPKIDDPALKIALNSAAFYVGALGSRKTHQNRLKRLHSAGLDQSLLDSIHAPVGLDLGGKSPPEIALGIMAEILSVMYRNDKKNG